jgi:hypothetical protein
MKILQDNNITIKTSKFVTELINFLSVADTIMDSTKTDKNDAIPITNPLNYLVHNFKYTFTKIKWRYTSTNEINRIIKSFKT